MTSDNESVLSSLSSDADVIAQDEDELDDSADVDGIANDGETGATTSGNTGARSGTSPASMLATSEETSNESDVDAVKNKRQRRRQQEQRRSLGAGSGHKRRISSSYDDDDDDDDDDDELSDVQSRGIGNANRTAAHGDGGRDATRKRQQLHDDGDDGDEDGSDLSTLTSEPDDFETEADDVDMDPENIPADGDDDAAAALQASRTLSVSHRRPRLDTVDPNASSQSSIEGGGSRPKRHGAADSLQGSHPERSMRMPDGQTSTRHFYGLDTVGGREHNGPRKRQRPYIPHSGDPPAIDANGSEDDLNSDADDGIVSGGHPIDGDGDEEEEDDLDDDQDDEDDEDLSDSTNDDEDDPHGIDRAQARSARRARKRGRGRPPKRQNALTAAAKRQASKVNIPSGSRSSSDNDHYYESDIGNLRRRKNEYQERATDAWPRHASMQLSPGKERGKFDLPELGDRTQKQLGQKADDSAQDVAMSRSKGIDRSAEATFPLPVVQAQRQLTKHEHPLVNPKFQAQSPPKQQQNFDLENTPHNDTYADALKSSNATAALKSDGIEFPNRTKLLPDGIHTDDIDLPKGSRMQQLADLDREDAMSGISDDVPILVQAHARAAAAAAAAGDIVRPDLYGSPDEDGEDIDDAEAFESYDHEMDPNRLHPPANGNRRRRSPSAHQVNKARGKAALAKARSKKLYLQQQRAQGVNHLHGEDVELSANSAAEEIPGDTDGVVSPHDIDTAQASDRDDDVIVGKDRSDALDALARIEIEFAKIRNQLFVERMDEIARERYQIESGSHPELLHLMHLIEQRRNARLEMARKTLSVSDESHARQSESQYHGIWYDWTSYRYSTSNAVVTEANHNRRRLDREKRAIERPRVDDLSSTLRLHAPPAHIYQERKSTLSYGLDYAVEYDLHDSLQRREKRGAVGLDREDIMYDLQRSGLREAYPAMPYYAYVAPHSGSTASAYITGPPLHLAGDDTMLDPTLHPPDVVPHRLDAPGRTVNSVTGPSHSARNDNMSAGSRHSAVTGHVFLPNGTTDSMKFRGRASQMLRA